MNRKIIAYTFFLITNISHGQIKKEILGVWVKTKLENLEKKVTPKIQQRNNQFTKYTFEKNNNLFLSLSPNEKGSLIKYRIEKNVLNLGFNKFEIEKIDNNQLVLVELINNSKNRNSIRIYFLKEQFFLNQLPINQEDILIENGDSFYFETDKVYPKFKNSNYANVKEFIQPFVENLSDNENAYSYATFIVDTKGNVSDVLIHHHINENYDKALRKAILRTRGMWIPPIVNGKGVAVIKSVSFNYIEFPDFKRKGDELTIEGKNSFLESFKNQFKNAVKLYLKDDFEKALNLLDEMEVDVPDNSSITNLKRIIYKKSGDSINFQRTTLKLKKSEFSYLVK